MATNEEQEQRDTVIFALGFLMGYLSDPRNASDLVMDLQANPYLRGHLGRLADRLGEVATRAGYRKEQDGGD
jgi:hypothetical protein